ncbi:MAG TPA: alpha/beta hydrolase [Pirellulaceae bacterium]|nr:alpha/beta hydrolase [Pirellulaceae bacterium]
MKHITCTAVLIGIWLSSVAHSAEFESEFISVKTRGTGPDVLLLHGFTCSSNVWMGVAEKLDSRFTLHLVQIAGFAGSPAPHKAPESYLNTLRDEVLRYIQVQELEKPILIGHSMGGLTSLRVAAKSPTSVGNVIVVDSLPFFSLIFDPSATSEQVTPFATAWEKATVAMNETQFEEQSRQGIAIQTKQQEGKDLLLKWSKASDRKAYAQIFRELMAYDARAELLKVTSPVTVIYVFDEAAKVPEDYVRQLYTSAYANLKGVRLHGVADSFHFIMWDQPESFTRRSTKRFPLHRNLSRRNDA